MNHRTQILLELYKRGDFSQLGLFSKQETALSHLQDDHTNEVLYGGGSRGGKSWLGCKWQLFNRMAMPGSNGMIAREELTKLKDTTLLTFFKVANHYGLERDKDYIITGQSPTAEFANGSRIFFREIKYIPSDPEFDRLGSYDLTDAFLDEAQQIADKARSVLRGRFSILTGPGWSIIPKVFYSCNPRRNWIYNDFVQPQSNGKLSDDKIFIPSLPTDNPYNSQAYLDNLLKADQTTIQRLYYGNFEYDDDPSALVDYDAVSDLFTNDHVSVNGRKRLSADLAMQGRDKFVVGMMDGGVIRIVAEKSKSSGKEIESILKGLMSEHRIGNTSVIADSDGMGAYLESYIRNIKTFHGNGRAKPEYSNLKSECAFKLAEKINKRELRIDCTPAQEDEIKRQLLNCLKRDNVDKDDTKKKLIGKDKMKEYLGNSPDHFDMLLMLMYFEIKKDYF